MVQKHLNPKVTARSGTQDGDQMAEFVLNLGRAGDGAGDFLAKQLAIAVAQSLHLFAQRRFVGPQFRCQHGIRD
jgi:hypothetical protein